MVTTPEINIASPANLPKCSPGKWLKREQACIQVSHRFKFTDTVALLLIEVKGKRTDRNKEPLAKS